METHRLKIDEQASKDRAQFSATLWRGSAVALELGIFNRGAVRDLSDASSLTLRVRSARLSAGLLLEKVVAAADFTACTAPQWAAGTHQHVTLEMTSEEMNFALADPPTTLFVSVTALLGSGGVQVLGLGEFILQDAGAVPGSTTPTEGTLLTLEEADARYVKTTGAQALTEEQQLQVLENLGITLTDSTLTLPNGRTIYLNAPDA
ncbi:MAG: hypothetical protein V4662_12110 [Verrucomicrobiota bacterium]